MGDRKYNRRVIIGGSGVVAPIVAAPVRPANRRDENPEIRRRRFFEQKNIAQILGKDENFNAVRKAAAAAPSITKKPAESKRKMNPPRKASTSTRKRTKTSNDKTEGGASSGRVVQDTASSSIGQVAAVHEKKTKEKPNPKRKSNKKKISENTKLKNKKKVSENTKLKQGEATPINKPRQFIGLYVCKEFDGKKTLGTVVSYEAQTKLFKIGYDNQKIEYIEQDEVSKIKATGKDIFEVRQQQEPSVHSKVPITSPED